jgi:hypothetical protein
VLLDDLAEALVSEGAVALERAAVQHPELPRAREPLQLVEQPGLADPRLAAHHHELALAGDGGVETPLQLGELLRAPHEGGQDRPGRGERHPGQGPRAVGVTQPRAVAPQRLGHVARARRPLRRLLLEAAEDDRLELLVDVRPQGARRLRQLVHDPVEDGLRVPVEGRRARHALVQHHAERVDVRAAVHLARHHLLGAQVGERSHEGAALREPALGGGAREAEVHHPHPQPGGLLRDHDVVRLDVAVDDALGVAVLERLGDLDGDLHDLAEGRAPAPELVQVGALDQGHHEEQRPLVASQVVERDDRGVVHLRDHLRLPLEALLGLGAQQRGRDQLDRDVTVEQRVARPVDDPHSAAAELGCDLVAVGQPAADHLASSGAGVSARGSMFGGAAL